ncbi:MAG: molybdenum cofactor biosynthesis protein MoaE [Synechococcales cyanobacterium]
MEPFSICTDPIDGQQFLSQLGDPRSGAVVTFEGRVRNHNQGLEVLALEYQIYETLALKEGRRILTEAGQRFQIHQAMACHRQGYLTLGEVAVWVGVSSSHRRDAFASAEYIIDAIKSRLPIWKKEHYVTGSAQWVCCQDHTLQRSLAAQIHRPTGVNRDLA